MGRNLTKALPHHGGGLGGGDVSRRKSRRDMKKHPVDGAHARARTLRQNMTEAERRVWQILRSHRMTGYQFRRQVPIGRYIADFVCHEARLIVEIDGGQHDRSSPREAERSGFLQNQGYRILRFGTTKSWQISTASMRRSLRSWAASPPPKPSPIEREGSKERTTFIVTTPRGPRLAPVRPICYTARLNQIRTPWWPLNQTPAPRPKKSPAVSSCWRCWRRS
jgi:very-short-patch-repair endonuclease